MSVRGTGGWLAGLALVVGGLAAEGEAAVEGLQGRITEIQADRGAFVLTVRSDRGDEDVLVVTTDRTEIFVDRQRARFGDLEVRMSAQVEGERQRDGSFRADQVFARSERDDDGRKRLRGVISDLFPDRSAFELTVESDRGTRTIVVQVRDRTRILIDRERAQFEDLELRMRATVTGQFDRDDDVFVARRVMARSNDDGLDELEGTISELFPRRGVFELLVETDRGTTAFLVATTDRTAISVDDRRARFGDLEVRMRAVVRGSFDADDRTLLHARVVKARTSR